MLRPLAFVAGATGFVGREAVAQLRAAGLETIAHVRPDSPSLPAWRTRFEALGAQVDATPWSLQAMTETFARLRPAYVFALQGTTRARMAGLSRAGADAASASYEAIDYGLTQLLVDACVAAGSRARFVYLSAAGVSGRSTGGYMRARHKAEEAVRRSGLPYTLARPAIITGARDEQRTGEHLGAVVGDALLSVAGALGAKRLRERYRSTTNEILARNLVRHALRPDGDAVTLESERLRE